MRGMDLLLGDYRFTTDPNDPSIKNGILSLYREDADPSLPGAEPGVWKVAEVSFDEYDGHWYVETIFYSIPLTIITELVAEAQALIKPPHDPGRETDG